MKMSDEFSSTFDILSNFYLNENKIKHCCDHHYTVCELFTDSLFVPSVGIYTRPNNLLVECAPWEANTKKIEEENLRLCRLTFCQYLPILKQWDFFILQTNNNYSESEFHTNATMNPLTNMKNVLKLSEQELRTKHKTSWHDQYKDSAWIFVGGLPYDLSEGDIICIFSQYGEVVNINLIRDKDNGKSKGFCFLCYEDQRSTNLAVDNFNGIKILNRIIRVDHVAGYKVPKEGKKTDEVTKQLYSEGCAPKPVPLLRKTPPRDLRETIADQIVTDIKLPQRLPIYPIKQEKTEDKVTLEIKKEKNDDKDKSERKKNKKSKKKKKKKRDGSSSEEEGPSKTKHMNSPHEKVNRKSSKHKLDSSPDETYSQSKKHKSHKTKNRDEYDSDNRKDISHHRKR